MSEAPDVASLDDMPTRLNLGCGFDHRDGYLNVDFEAAHEPDLLSDVRTLDGLPDGRFTEILAQDILEHLPRSDTAATLQRWSDLLAVDGTIYIRTTDVIGLAGMMAHHRDPANQFEFMHLLFGTQAYTGDFHLNAFTEVTLRSLLHDAGLEVVSIERFDNWLLDCVAVKPAVLGPLDLSNLTLMDIPDYREPVPPARASVGDRAVSAVAAALPSGLAGSLRPAWRRLRSTAVATVRR